MLLLTQSTETGNERDLFSNVGSEIRVALDRWSTGQMGLSDAVLAGALLVAAGIGAWIVRRMASRWSPVSDGPASAPAIDIPAATLRLTEVVSSIDHVLDEPPLEVVTTSFDGTQVLVDVLFWHRPEIWAERVARDRVGRVVIELLEASDLALADVALAVTTAGPVESG